MNNKSHLWKSVKVSLFWLRFLFWQIKKDRPFSICHKNTQSLAIEFTSFFTIFIQVSWKMSSILTQIIYTTLSHTVIVMVEIQKQ